MQGPHLQGEQLPESLKCTECGEEVHPLEVFPGGRCLACWTPIGEEKAKTMTAEKLAAMWGAKPRKRK